MTSRGWRYSLWNRVGVSAAGDFQVGPMNIYTTSHRPYPFFGENVRIYDTSVGLYTQIAEIQQK